MCTISPTLTNSTGILNDGSGGYNYKNNLNCSWLISPEHAQRIELNITLLNTEKNSDVLKIHDGIDASAPLLGSFSGKQVSSTVFSTEGNVFVEFNTDSDSTDEGWSVDYNSYSCKELTVLTNNTDTINDGSEDGDYFNYCNCKWLIQPNNAESITLSFLEFATELDYDHLYIYDGETTSASLLAVFHGASLPEDITSSGGTMLLHFKSDSYGSNKGWTAYYKTDKTDIFDKQNNSNLKIYPNPTKGILFIENNSFEINEIEIYDLYGKLILKKEIRNIKENINLTSLPAGVYFLGIKNENSYYLQKIIKY